MTTSTAQQTIKAGTKISMSDADSLELLEVNSGLSWPLETTVQVLLERCVNEKQYDG